MPENCAAIVIAAKHHELTKVKDTRGTTNTIGALRCKFQFRTDDWLHSAKTAMFCNGDAVLHPEVIDDAIAVPLDADDECPVPYEVLTDTLPYSIGVWGVTDNGLRVVSNWLVFNAQLGCYTEGNAPEDPERTIYEEILLISREAVEAASDVTNRANNGEFDGKTAYEIAKEEGFDGSASEWIQSLVGEPGQDGYTPVKGKDYFDGKDGAAGKDGDDGFSPTVSVEKIEDGHRVVIVDKNSTNTFDVVDGTNGEDGITPHIGENGNWWIGDKDTGVKTSGQDVNGANIIDVVSLPTNGIDTEATYRVLNGTFVLDKMLRNDSVCHIVEWDSVPTEQGESVIKDTDGAFGYVGYYNVKDNTVYGYFGNDTVEYLIEWVNNSDLNIIAKIALIAYLERMTAGWRTMQEIVSSVGSHLSMSWGGVITSVESADDGDALYLYLYSKMFVNKNGVWIGLDEGVGKTGEGIGAEVFNHPNNVASGTASHAEGSVTSAEGDFSHAEGFGSKAAGKHSHAEGLNTTASGNTDHAEGYGTMASGNYSHAEGSATRAKGQTAHAEGYNTEASGTSAHAEGDTTKAIGAVSHAEGSMTTAGATGAHAEGGATKAEAAWSHAEGYGATARGVSAHAEGQNTIAETAAHAEGLQTEATGLYSHSEGMSAKASGQSAHAEGESTKATANASHAEGYSTEASGVYAHGEGALTVASGVGSHAEGGSTKATEAWAHAEGYGATASGNSSHAEGINTVASGECSYAGGKNTIATGEAQTVIGKYNVTDTTSVFIIGNGTQSIRSNAMTVDWNGNAIFAGIITSNGNRVATEADMEGLYDYFCTKGPGITSTDEQTVVGGYNIADDDKVFIVGNGYMDGKWPVPSNAHTIDWDGNAWFSGEVKVGGTGQDDENAKTLATQEFVTDILTRLCTKLQEKGVDISIDDLMQL